ncbi:MAG: serine/threonine protein kinase [Myxococcales bacterium]|nr:serine/threonine protein kinase [Myxococcales bacterium]
MTATFPQLFGRYTLLQRVAYGGMAEILLAIEDTPHAGKRFVTIKRIRSEYARDPDFIEFFVSEGRVSVQCSHPNLTRSFDLDQVGATHYLAMEYIRGHTLLDVVRTCHEAKTKLSIPSVLRIAGEVAAGLDHLHNMRDAKGNALNVVHRDVTPQNIMVDAKGSVKLIDLGIARSDMQVHKTEVGTVKGKPSYIAPEQLAARRTLDARADIFSLGIVMHEALTTRGLFRGRDDTDTLRRVRKMAIPTVSSLRENVPPEVDALVARALDRDPESRYQTASDFLRSLASLPETARPCSQSNLRDEVLGFCGDPAVPTLGGEAFSALKAALSPEAPQGAEPEEPSIDYFLQKARIDGKD